MAHSITINVKVSANSLAIVEIAASYDCACSSLRTSTSGCRGEYGRLDTGSFRPESVSLRSNAFLAIT